jgi:hypothetical protein
MNRHQKWVLTNFIFVVLITAVVVSGMIELKNWVNLSESMRVFGQLWQAVETYKQKNGSLPPESYIDSLKTSFEGQMRLGNLNYRARWIKFDSSPDTVLAYVRKGYNSFLFHPGAIVLRLDGRIEWMDRAGFDKLIKAEQTNEEIQMTPEKYL